VISAKRKGVGNSVSSPLLPLQLISFLVPARSGNRKLPFASCFNDPCSFPPRCLAARDLKARRPRLSSFPSSITFVASHFTTDTLFLSNSLASVTHSTVPRLRFATMKPSVAAIVATTSISVSAFGGHIPRAITTTSG
jgi:hypothetical protein